MKKLILISILLLTGCTITSEKTYISKKISLNLDDCKIENSKDTHEGFLGDGTYFAKITCENLDQKIYNWEKMPLKDDIKEALDLVICGENDCKNVFERYNIPEINEGFYYFLDRNPKANEENDPGLNNRASYNYSVAIFDNNKTIYFYELDT